MDRKRQIKLLTEHNNRLARQLAEHRLNEIETEVAAERRRRGLADIVAVDDDGNRHVIGSVRPVLPPREEFP